MKRSRTSKAWLHEHVTDQYVRRAKSEGFRSRAAFKLKEIADRDRLLRPGMTVVDLGAAPGGWSQVAAGAVTPGGRVIALDLLEMAPVREVTFIQGDFHEESVLARLEDALSGGSPDLVLSDIAPNLTGIAAVDQARTLGLAERALDFARRRLKPDGAFLVKLFQGAEYESFLAEMRRAFREVQVRKPKASRDRSSEVYLLGKSPIRDTSLAREPLPGGERGCVSRE